MITTILPDEPIPDFQAYLDLGGGEGLRRALSMDPEDVIAEVRASGLRGRGGAGFPTGIKWGSVRDAGAGATTYLVCNAAEGEPGTYKDRTLMVRDPFQLIEGILIALHAVGARAAYIGTKEKFTHERARLAEALDAMRDAGWERVDDVHVVPGPDEYLYGEESAMLEVIEEKLPMPRILPPYMSGLFATMQDPNPTVVNNVESLSHVTRIMAAGADAWRELGTEESPGTMVFTVTGDCENPGVYELPLGTPLRTLICDIGGADDIKCILPGTSAGVITPDLLDLPMDFDSFAEAGTGLGSGGYVVYDSTRDMVQLAYILARFLAIESCGQCNACGLGTLALYESLGRMVRGQGTSEDLSTLHKRTNHVADQNRCFLPMGAALVIRSLMEEFAQEFEEHLGVPSDPAVAVPVPKIADLNHDTGEVLFDPRYHLKRLDWSYRDEG